MKQPTNADGHQKERQGTTRKQLSRNVSVMSYQQGERETDSSELLLAYDKEKTPRVTVFMCAFFKRRKTRFRISGLSNDCTG